MEPKRVTITPDSELDRLLVEAAGTPVLLEKDGVRQAAIISAEDLERFNRIEAEREARFKALDATRAAFADVPDEELDREVAGALADVRVERRAEEQRAAGNQ